MKNRALVKNLKKSLYHLLQNLRMLSEIRNVESDAIGLSLRVGINRYRHTAYDQIKQSNVK